MGYCRVMEMGLLVLVPEGDLLRHREAEESMVHQLRIIHCSTNVDMVYLGIAMRLPLPTTPIATEFSLGVEAAHLIVGAVEIEDHHHYN